jgi:Protein of unknown function (DUF2637)
VPDRLIRITTALAVVAVAGVAAIISYQHAYELVTFHGETGLTAHLLPFTVDGLIWAASMVVLDASRQRHPVPPLAMWSLAVGIVATIGANLAHGLGHGPIGAMVSAWPALALVGSFELLMLLIRSHHKPSAGESTDDTPYHELAAVEQDEPIAVSPTLTVEQTVRAWHGEGRSQRAIARELNIDRRKVKQIIDRTAALQPTRRFPAARLIVAAGTLHAFTFSLVLRTSFTDSRRPEGAARVADSGRRSCSRPLGSPRANPLSPQQCSVRQRPSVQRAHCWGAGGTIGCESLSGSRRTSCQPRIHQRQRATDG